MNRFARPSVACTVARVAALVLLACGACAGPAAVPPATAGPAWYPLFVIQRSKNANEVHYDALVWPDGTLDPSQPVQAYWVLLAEDGQRKELNWIERTKAYGFEISPLPGSEGYQMTVVSLPTRPITVRVVNGTPRAETTINGRPAVLSRVFIKTAPGGLMPQVEYIDLYGTDLKTGTPVQERLVSQ